METLELTRTEAEAQSGAGAKTIADYIDDIIRQRKSKYPKLAEKEKKLDEICTMLDNFDKLKGQIIDKEGNTIQGQYAAIVNAHPDIPMKLQNMDTRSCRERIQEAREELTAVKTRFERDCINIGIVGMARCGKSLAFRSITGLSEKVIPTSDGPDCTGAVSIIENDPNMQEGEVRAIIKFKTERQILDIVQAYLDTIIAKQNPRITVSRLENVKVLNMQDIQQKMDPAASTKLEQLRKYVEHYDTWAPFVESGEKTVNKPEEIQPFVAQYKVDEPSTSFYEYLAVESCQIKCAFRYKKAGKITLVDTVGLGDHKLGITEDMIRVTHESDAVIFQHCPRNGGGSGIPNYVAAIYNDIFRACSDRNLNDWMAWLINWDHRPTSDNGQYAEMALRTLETFNWAGSVKKIVDASNPDEVQKEFLIPMLDNLCQHLPEIDALYMGKLNDALRSVRVAYDILCEQAEKLMNGNNVAAQFNGGALVRNMKETINYRLNLLSNKDDARGRDKRNVPCGILADRVEEILKDINNDTMLPDRDELLWQIQHGTAYIDVIVKNMHGLRNTVVQRFSEIDSSLEKMVVDAKNSVARIFMDEDGCRLCRVMPQEPDQEPYEWLRSFAQVQMDEKAYPNLYAAIMKVCDFTFSVKAFLTYEVRACLDELDPDLSVIPMLRATNDVARANAIRSILLVKLVNAGNALDGNMKTLLTKPNKAIFAMFQEFKDQVQHADNVEDEWDALFAKNCSIIWADQYRQMVLAQSAFQDWDNLRIDMRRVKNDILQLERA